MADPDDLAKLIDKRRNIGPSNYYTACMPVTPNTFLFSPLYESRMLAWIAWRFELDGYEPWAYQSWPDTRWTNPKHVFSSGDSFLVYPGKNGPIGSVRWGMLRQGIGDYEALRLLRAQLDSLNKDPAYSKRIAEIQDALKQAVGTATKPGGYG